MDVTPIISEEKKIIKGYGDGFFKLNEDEIIEGNIIITQNNVLKWNFLDSFNEINIDSFSQLYNLNENVDILLLGCGNKHLMMPAELQMNLRKKGLNVETMTTGAACRTYNVLLSEGRDVAACLIKM